MNRQEAFEFIKLEHIRFDKTREIQWKFNFIFWTLIILGTYNFKIIKDNIHFCYVLDLSVLFLIAHMIFIWRTQRALEATKKIEKHLLKQLNSTVEEMNVTLDIEEQTKEISMLQPTTIWWLLFQLLSTSILLAIFLLLIH